MFIKGEKTSGIHKWSYPLPPLPPLSLSNWPSWISLPDLSWTLCVGPWILQGSYCPSSAVLTTHTHTHRCTEALKGGPWQNPHHPCDLCPSPLTWLSNYHIDYAATTTLPSTFTHSDLFSYPENISAGVLLQIWSDGYIPNHISNSLTKSSADCWLVWTTSRAREYGRPAWLCHTSSLPLCLAALVIKVLACPC